jgi:16S rRNA (guanine966-N2)-methyltransferase
MRITSGGARGIPLAVPRGEAVRPATDRMRQAVFSSLGGLVVGARFVDLFAGSGSYGLEALSRGARGGIFVERDRRALECLRRNLAAVCRSLGREPAELEVRGGDVLAWVPAPDAPRARLVFIDPPYALVGGQAGRLFALCDALLEPGADGRVVLEMPAELRVSAAGWTCVRRLGSEGRGAPAAGIYARTGELRGDG